MANIRELRHRTPQILYNPFAFEHLNRDKRQKTYLGFCGVHCSCCYLAETKVWFPLADGMTDTVITHKHLLGEPCRFWVKNLFPWGKEHENICGLDVWLTVRLQWLWAKAPAMLDLLEIWLEWRKRYWFLDSLWVWTIGMGNNKAWCSV